MTVTPSSPCPAQSPISAVEDSELQPTHPREPPPDQSDNDQVDPRRPYPCLDSSCTRRFTGQYTLRVHMATHKPKPRAAFLCTLGCLEKFSRQHDRLRHEVAKHGKICEFTCKECGRFFSTQKTLGKHKCPRVRAGLCWVDNWKMSSIFPCFRLLLHGNRNAYPNGHPEQWATWTPIFNTTFHLILERVSYASNWISFPYGSDPFLPISPFMKFLYITYVTCGAFLLDRSDDLHWIRNQFSIL